MLDRAAATTDLAYRYGLMLTSAGMPATDTADGFGPVLDRVDTIAAANPDLSEATLTTLARYLTLDVLVDRLGAQFDVSTGGDSYRLNQLYTNAKALRESLASVIAWLALDDVATGASAGLVTITAPYLGGEDGTW